MATLQLSVVLAADDVGDLMRALHPMTVESNFKGPADSEGEANWHAKIQVPGAMLVSTMLELSEWGPSMGIALVSCTVTSLGLFPFSIATGHTSLLLSCVALQIIPLLIALAPAEVSSSCDDLMEQLNEISFLGDMGHKDRCDHLRKAYQQLNRGQVLLPV